MSRDLSITKLVTFVLPKDPLSKRSSKAMMSLSNSFLLGAFFAFSLEVIMNSPIKSMTNVWWSFPHFENVCDLVCFSNPMAVSLSALAFPDLQFNRPFPKLVFESCVLSWFCGCQKNPIHTYYQKALCIQGISYIIRAIVCASGRRRGMTLSVSLL